MESEKEVKELRVDQKTAFVLKLQEFDYKISEAEAVAADLKKQRCKVIYDDSIHKITIADKERQLIEKARNESLSSDIREYST